jgi:urocanate hydratase
MPSDLPNLPTEQNPAEPVFRRYMALAATLPLDLQSGLGGKLLYAGELNSQGRNLLYAANIAGAASLATSADPAVQRQAIRDGVIDFLVTSLEEALRILKNEIRKHQPVSVGISADPHWLAAQMLDRGVLPDLLSAASPNQASGIDPAQAERFLSQ